MESNTIRILFKLLSSAICDNKIQDEEKQSITNDMFPELFTIAKRHDIAPLLAYSLDFNAIYCNNKDMIRNEILIAIYRYERINFEYNRICTALEEAQIPFIPLKGAVLRKYYTEPWLRTSCDIDILVHNEDIEKATTYLVNNYEYSCGEKGRHEISLYSANKVHVELHYELIEEGIANASSKVVNTVWEDSVVLEGHKYWYEMTDKMFYFYHIAHMAKHFVSGGCGIKPFIDLWILDNMVGANIQERNRLLKYGDIFQFAKAARQLSKVWFCDLEHDNITKQIEQFILCGGVYGTTENRIAIQHHKKGSRIKYILSRVFVPYDNIKSIYPVLQKHRWLTPIMEIRRWLNLAFGGHAKRSISTLKYVNSISNTEADNVRSFLNNIGL